MKSFSRNRGLRRSQPLLGTFVEIALGGKPYPELLKASSGAFEVIRKIHRLMSFHDPESDVSRLNRAACKHPVKVHPWTARVLKLAEKFYRDSGGIFDVSIAPSLVRWGYLPEDRFHRPLCIDLGGIAKGFAVDQAVRTLKKQGIPWGMVNAGGDLRIFGRRSQKIYIRHPAAPGQLILLGNFHEKAVATSGVYFSRKIFRGREVTPLVDARSGRPYRGRASVTVVADSCAVADALTKVMMLGKRAGLPLLKAHRAEAFFLGQGKTHAP